MAIYKYPCYVGTPFICLFTSFNALIMELLIQKWTHREYRELPFIQNN